MKCKTCQKYLLLYRRGELSFRQKEKMEHHITRCAECAGVRQKTDRLMEQVGYLRQKEPRLTEPVALTDSIMHSVQTLGGRRKIRDIDSAANFFWNTMAIPKIRLVLAGIIFLIISSFFIQEFLVLDRLSRLEEKIAQQSPPVGGSGNAMIINTKRILKTADLEKFKTLAAVNIDESRRDEWVLIHRSSLESLIAANTRLHDNQERLLDTLTTLLPDLKIISLENGLDRKELRLLRQNKNRIIQTLYKL